MSTMHTINELLVEETKKVLKTEAVRALAVQAHEAVRNLGVRGPINICYRADSAEATIVLQWKVAESHLSQTLTFRVGKRTSLPSRSTGQMSPQQQIVAQALRKAGLRADPRTFKIRAPGTDSADTDSITEVIDFIIATDGSNDLTAYLELDLREEARD